MEIQAIIDFLRSAEITESELLNIYERFGRGRYNEGFKDGCNYMRDVFVRQKQGRKIFMSKKCNEFLTYLDDYINS